MVKATLSTFFVPFLNSRFSPSLVFVTLILLLASLGFGLGACSDRSQQVQKIAGTTMGTRYSIQYLAMQPSPDAAEIKKAADILLNDIENKMSTYRSDSELSRLNRAPVNEWITLSPELFLVIQKALEISVLSEGAFDVTVGPLVNIWGFGPDTKAQDLPSEQQIQKILSEQVGYQYLTLDVANQSIKKQKPGYIDLSAIVPGYGADRLADLLTSYGIENYLVDISGELRASGTKAKKQPWRIAIEKPVLSLSGDHNPFEQIIELKNTGIATSGDYRNFFIVENKLYSHTIDPKTGKPITHNLASVTVLHPSAMDADALATAFTVMGAEKAMAYAEKQKLAVFLVLREADKLEHKSSSRFNELLVRTAK